MANKAKKTKAGTYRCQVYDYTDDEGRRIYKSFTGKTKSQVEAKAAEYTLNKQSYRYDNLTLETAREEYIKSKSNILSPASIRGYNQMGMYYKSIDCIKLTAIDQKIVTEWVNKLAIDHSPKTVRNAHGLLTAILRQYAPTITLNTVLPQKIAPVYSIPSDNDIKALTDYFKEHDRNMLIALYLAAFGTLRRSEICALTANDIRENRIHVCRAMVKDSDKNFVIKTTKTLSSDRYIELPEFVIDVLPKRGRVVSVNPDYITHNFGKTLKKLKIKSFRFHDLRHYSASIMHAIGVPDQYIMQRGGWQNDTVLKAVYRDTLDDYQRKFSAMTNDYFSKISL